MPPTTLMETSPRYVGDLKRRTELVQAVIARMFHVHVLTPLLFGGNFQPCQIIAQEEASLASDNSLEGRKRHFK